MAPARGGRVDEQLLLNIARGTQPEGANVSMHVVVVRARRREEILPAVRGKYNVSAVLVARRKPRRDQWVGQVREDGDVAVLVNHIYAEPVTGFHQDVEIVTARVDGDPTGMIVGGGCVDTVDQRQGAGLRVFLVRPDLVGAQVRRVQVCFRRIEDHAMDARVRDQFEILNISVDLSGLVYGKHVAESCVVVERVAVNVVRRLMSSQNKDSSCVGVGRGRES